MRTSYYVVDDDGLIRDITKLPTNDRSYPSHEYPATWQVCEQCNYDNHRCHFCGEYLTHAEAESGHCDGN